MPGEAADVGASTGPAGHSVRRDGADTHPAGQPATLLLPASYAQRRLWFFTQLVPDVAVYNIGFPLPLRMRVDAGRLRRALAHVVRRHETLRTSLTEHDGTLMQVVHTELTPELTEVDLRHLPPEQAQRLADELRVADCATPFDPGRAPLWRARLVHLTDELSMFEFVVHHAVFDARSVDNLVTELLEAYRADEAARPADLPELPIQYADFAAWQHAQLDSGALDYQLEYWRRQLSGLAPEIGLPTDRPRPARPSYAGSEVWFTVPTDTATAMRRYAAERGVTPYAVLLAAFSVLLHRLAGQPDIAVGSPVAGRQLPELEPLLGMFVNTVVLRVDCAGDPPFDELVGRTMETVLDAIEHVDVPFDRLVDVLAPGRDPARSPLYQVVLNLIPSIGGWQVGNGTARVDLTVDLVEEQDGTLAGRLEYSTDLFEERTARSMVDRFVRLLGAALAAPHTAVSRLPLLLAGERERLLAAAVPGTPPVAEPVPVLERFARGVRLHPDSVAVRDGAGRRLTYREVDALAERLAVRLGALGAGPDRPVALLLDTDAWLPVAVLAVLRAGAPYLVLDIELPADRMRFLLADAGAAAIVTTEANEATVIAETATAAGKGVDGGAARVWPTVLVGTGLANADTADADTAGACGVGGAGAGRPDGPPSPDSLAYVVYTSGSTGRPKGVGVTHRNLAAYLDGLVGLLDPPAGGVWSMIQPLTFDFAATTLFGALLTGGTLVLVDREQASDAGRLAAHLRDDAVDYLKITPSHLNTLLPDAPSPAALTPGRTLILGGEATPWEQFRRLREVARGTVVNHYGPTETTVGTLALPADRSVAPVGGSTPIGWPLRGAAAYVLDRQSEPVPDGMTGELCIGGLQVSRGYLGQPGPTADRFVPDPFSGRSGARLYRTGDRVRRLPGGAVEFLGRIDDQVKIRGYRVEPGEVRHVLAGHPDVADSAVIAADAGTDRARLLGYLVPVAGRRPDPAAVRAYAAASLPEYMLPAVLVTLDELPLTPHGKLDRSRLLEIATEPADQPAGDAPSGEFEEVIAGLFGTLLRRDRVRRTDSFLAIGGHSLLAIQLMSRLRKTFGVTLPLRVIFEEPTVANLAAKVAGRLQAAELPPIKPVPRDQPLMPSYGEQRLWFIDQLTPGSTMHNVHLLRRLTGELQARVLERALLEVVRRHEVLRSRFVVTAAGLTKVIDPAPAVPFEIADLTTTEPRLRGGERERLLVEHGGRPFNLATEQPIRALLIRLAPREHQLLVTVHHAVFDGPSVEVLAGELGELYPALRDGREPQLPELLVQYGDFAAWQRETVAGDLAGTQLAYWRRQLAGLPARLELPSDRPRPPRLGTGGAHRLFAVPGELADALRAFAAGEGATLFMAALAGYVELLRRRTGQTDLAVGVPLISRQRPELEPLIGFFVNTLVLRVSAAGDPSFRELVRRVRGVTIEAYANSDVPFEALVDELAPDRDPSVTPLVQTMLMLADDRRALPVDLGGVAMEFEPFGVGTAKFDLFLYLWRRPDGLTCVAEYRPELFDDETIRRLVSDYTELLAAAVADPDSRLPAVRAERPVN